MLHLYTPELGQTLDPKITTHGRLAHYGNHYYVESILGPNVIRGRGVTYRGVSRTVGYYSYKLTLKAYEKLQETVEIGERVLLD
jgi:hypothetical protein